MSGRTTHPQTQIGGVKSEQEDNTTNNHLEVSGDKKVRLGRKRGPWGTIPSDKDSIVDESNTRAKSERQENIGRNQPEVPRVKKIKLGRERGQWDQNTIHPAEQGLSTDELRRTRVWKVFRPQFGPWELDQFRAQHLAGETTTLSIVTASKSSTSAGKSGTKDNDADARTVDK